MPGLKPDKSMLIVLNPLVKLVSFEKSAALTNHIHIAVANRYTDY
jgi:hypothetical protein